MAETTSDILIDRSFTGKYHEIFGFPATESTESWRRCESGKTKSDSFTSAMKKPLLSWHARTPSTPANWACASPLRAQAEFIC